MSLLRGNLLSRAAKLIPLQEVVYYQDVGRVDNEFGIYQTAFASPVEIRGSVQAVPLSAFEYLGLQFGKTYVNFFTKTPVIGLDRDVSGDRFAFDGKIYQCQSVTDWYKVNGWKAILAVMTDLTTAIPDSAVINPDDEYVVTPGGDYIPVLDSTIYLETPEGSLVTTPEDNAIIVPQGS